MKIWLPAPDAVLTLDEEDLPLFSAHRWTIVRGGYTRYAMTRLNGKRPYLHRLLMKAQAHDVVDHIDGNGLNNSRSNLRIVTQKQNVWNRRRGREPGRFGNKFSPMMRINGRRYHLGIFDDRFTAIQARAYVEARIRGEYAPDQQSILAGFDPLKLSPTIRSLLSDPPLS